MRATKTLPRSAPTPCFPARLLQRPLRVGRTFGGGYRHFERAPLTPDLERDLVAGFQCRDQEPRLLGRPDRLIIDGEDDIAVRKAGDGSGTVRDYPYQDADVSFDAERSGFRPRKFLRIGGTHKIVIPSGVAGGLPTPGGVGRR